MRTSKHQKRIFPPAIPHAMDAGAARSKSKRIILREKYPAVAAYIQKKSKASVFSINIDIAAPTAAAGRQSPK